MGAVLSCGRSCCFVSVSFDPGLSLRWKMLEGLWMMGKILRKQ